MNENVKSEIIRLHQFFTLWFNGRIEEQEIDQFISVIHDDFILITPNGQIIDKSEIIEAIKKSYNSKEFENNFKIVIVNVRVTHSSENYFQAMYNEVQYEDNLKTNRLSSVLFKINEKLENKLEWIHVHETWVN